MDKVKMTRIRIIKDGPDPRPGRKGHRITKEKIPGVTRTMSCTAEAAKYFIDAGMGEVIGGTNVKSKNSEK